MEHFLEDVEEPLPNNPCILHLFGIPNGDSFALGSTVIMEANKTYGVNLGSKWGNLLALKLYGSGTYSDALLQTISTSFKCPVFATGELSSKRCIFTKKAESEVVANISSTDDLKLHKFLVPDLVPDGTKKLKSFLFFNK